MNAPDGVRRAEQAHVPGVCSHGKDSPNRLLLKGKDGQNEYTGCDEITTMNFIRNSFLID